MPNPLPFRPFTDAGHGLKNLGTHDEMAVVTEDGSRIWRPDPSGLIEKVVVLDIEDRLHNSIKDAPLHVGRSRRCDREQLTQGDRGRRSRLHGAIWVASLHVNDCPDPRIGGCQLYVGEHNKRTLALANDFAGPLAKLFGDCRVIKAFKPKDPHEPGISEEEKQKRLRDRWIENPRSIILAHTADVILFELGFRQNEHDRKLLMSENGREQITSILRWCVFRAGQHYGS